MLKYLVLILSLISFLALPGCGTMLGLATGAGMRLVGDVDKAGNAAAEAGGYNLGVRARKWWDGDSSSPAEDLGFLQGCHELDSPVWSCGKDDKLYVVIERKDDVNALSVAQTAATKYGRKLVDVEMNPEDRSKYLAMELAR